MPGKHAVESAGAVVRQGASGGVPEAAGGHLQPVAKGGLQVG